MRCCAYSRAQWLIEERTLLIFRGVVLVIGVILTAIATTTSSSDVSGDQLYSVREARVLYYGADFGAFLT